MGAVSFEGCRHGQISDVKTAHKARNSMNERAPSGLSCRSASRTSSFLPRADEVAANAHVRIWHIVSTRRSTLRDSCGRRGVLEWVYRGCVGNIVGCLRVHCPSSRLYTSGHRGQLVQCAVDVRYMRNSDRVHGPLPQVQLSHCAYGAATSFSGYSARSWSRTRF
jgi:hypothetical protein